MARAADQRPLHQRVWEVEREREHKLRLLLADKEEREGATFAPPPLGRVSERLVTRDNAWEDGGGGGGGIGGGGGGGGGGRLASRLQEQAMWARERRRLRVQEHEEVREFECVASGLDVVCYVLLTRGGASSGRMDEPTTDQAE